MKVPSLPTTQNACDIKEIIAAWVSISSGAPKCVDAIARMPSLPIPLNCGFFLITCGAIVLSWTRNQPASYRSADRLSAAACWGLPLLRTHSPLADYSGPRARCRRRCASETLPLLPALPFAFSSESVFASSGISNRGIVIRFVRKRPNPSLA